MAIQSGSLLSKSILAQMKLKSLTGRDATHLASAVGNAVSSVLTKPNMVSCNLTGLMGATSNLTGIQVFGVNSKLMSANMFVANKMRFTGRDRMKLFDAIAAGLAPHLKTMILTGTAVGLGTGAGTGRFTALTSQMLYAAMYARAYRHLRGRDIGTLIESIAYGIVNHLKTTVTILVTAAGSPVPAYPPVPTTGVSATTSLK